MKTKVIVAAATILVPVVAYVATRVSFEGSTIALEERFPHLSSEVVRAAHKSMVKDTLAGRLECDTDNDEEMDALFLDYVNRLTY